MSDHNVDPAEIAKFEALAARWWDPEGESAALHLMNPVRMRFIREAIPLEGARVLDVGCGGGLLSEAMAAAGATVVAIDAAEAPLEIARLHLLDTQAGDALDIDYRCSTAEAYAASTPAPFDLITCLELLEHVPDPASVVGACAELLRPGGHLVLSTLNRNPRAWFEAILGAEFILRMLPRGTHDYARFIRPSELAALCRDNHLSPQRMAGMRYDPLRRDFDLGDDLKVNYLLHATRDESE